MRELTGGGELYTALWQEANAMYEDWARQRDLSYCELLAALSLAGDTAGCTQTDICRQWLLSKQTVNTVLKSFIRRGWVSLSPSGEDRRNKVILLTETGLAFVNTVSAQLRRHEQAVWDKMGRERAQALLETTALYNRLFKELDQ